MKDDIKEILEHIDLASELYDLCLTPPECKQLLNYITNLQKENQRLKNEKNELINIIKYLHNDYEKICNHLL